MTWIFQVLFTVVSYEVLVPAKYTTAITSVGFEDSKMSFLVQIHQLHPCQNTNAENSFAEVFRTSPWLQCPSFFIAYRVWMHNKLGLGPCYQIIVPDID